MVIELLLDPVDGSGARDAARRELERSEYHRDDPGIVSRVLDWIGDRLGELFGGGTGSNATLLLLVLAVAVIVILAVRAGPPSLRRRAGRDRGYGHDADPLAPTSSRDHRRAAARFEDDSRLAEALREWLRAAIAVVEERGVLPPRPGRTGAATAREAAPVLPAAADDLRSAMTSFEQVWFGGRAASPADVDAARRAADAVAAARMAVAGSAAPDLPRW